jgi:tetratricopeptide (TPR) repeat protein
MLEIAFELRAHGHRAESLQIAERAASWYETNGSEIRRALIAAERWKEALGLYRRLAEERPDRPGYLAQVGTLAARTGDEKVARDILARLEQMKRPYSFGAETYWRAGIHALLDENEQAVALLRQSFDEGQAFGIYSHQNVDLETLRGYAPFEDLMKPQD